jgi:hypothetical protein
LAAFGAFWHPCLGGTRGVTGCFICVGTEGPPKTKNPRGRAQLRHTAPERTKPHQTAPNRTENSNFEL